MTRATSCSSLHRSWPWSCILVMSSFSTTQNRHVQNLRRSPRQQMELAGAVHPTFFRVYPYGQPFPQTDRGRQAAAGARCSKVPFGPRRRFNGRSADRLCEYRADFGNPFARGASDVFPQRGIPIVKCHAAGIVHPCESDGDGPQRDSTESEPAMLSIVPEDVTADTE